MTICDLNHFEVILEAHSIVGGEEPSTSSVTTTTTTPSELSLDLNSEIIAQFKTSLGIVTSVEITTPNETATATAGSFTLGNSTLSVSNSSSSAVQAS